MSTLPPRRLAPLIAKDLAKKMVFLGGPRQVGKTTLAQQLLGNYSDGHPGYLNWDLDEHRAIIRKRSWPAKQRLIVLDELHKMRGWRSLVKGFYDTLKNSHSFLITGSARLDHLRRGGDSLLGRYHYYRLHPYSLPELGATWENFHDLMEYGGFPEVLAMKNLTELRRWHRSRLSKLVRVDLREIENVQDIDKMELLAEELPRRVGSPLSVRSVAEDLSIDPKTAKRWIEILDSLYYCFQIAPYGSPKIKAVKKEQKLYLWDWTQVEDEGLRFENMMACQLLKFCHYHEDVFGERMELRYLRDINRREVDFVVLKNKKPLFAVECKLRPQPLHATIPYFRDRTPIPVFYQVSSQDDRRQVDDRTKICSYLDFCDMAGMV